MDENCCKERWHKELCRFSKFQLFLKTGQVNDIEFWPGHYESKKSFPKAGLASL